MIVWVSGCDFLYAGENLKVFNDDLFSYFCYKPSYLKVFEVVSGDEFELTKFGIRNFSLVPFFFVVTKISPSSSGSVATLILVTFTLKIYPTLKKNSNFYYH